MVNCRSTGYKTAYVKTTGSNHEPLVITLRLDEEAQDYFNALRKRYFPVHLNFLSAHLTLFHQLPNTAWIIKQWSSAGKKSTFELTVTEPYHTGFGVAFRLHAAELIKRHTCWQKASQMHLTAQDRQKLHPHVTIQNKVSRIFKSITAAIAERLCSVYNPGDRHRQLAIPEWPVAASGFLGL